MPSTQLEVVTVCPWSMSLSSPSVYTSRAVQQSLKLQKHVTVIHLPSGSPQTCLQDVQPCFIHTMSFCSTSGFIRMRGKALSLDPNRSFTCRCCTFTCIHCTHSYLISRWTTETKTEVLTIPLPCEKNAALLPLKGTLKMLVVKWKSYCRSTRKL